MEEPQKKGCKNL